MESQSILETCPFHLRDDKIRLLWEITSRCNLKCRHCLYYGHGVDEDRCRDLSVCEVERILDSIAEDKRVTAIWLSGGEPLVRKDIVEICSSITRHGIIPSISTNGTLLTANLIEALWTAGVHYIHLSIDGSKASTHDELRQSPGAFDKVLKALEMLASSPIDVGASFMVTEQSIGEVFDVYRLAQSFGVKTLSFYTPAPLGRGRQMHSNSLLLNKKMITILASFPSSNIKVEAPRLYLKNNRDNVLQTCRGSSFLTITSTGDLGACPWLMKSPLSFTVGNLLLHPFSELVGKCRDGMHNLLESRLSKLVFCRNKCENHNVCGKGCPALSSLDSETEFYYMDPMCPQI